MFRRLADTAAATLRFTFEGRELTGMEGDTVAAALLAAGVEICRRSGISGAARGPFCLMGVCFECLMVIEGVGNRQACQVILKQGMQVQVQDGRREAAR